MKTRIFAIATLLFTFLAVKGQTTHWPSLPQAEEERQVTPFVNTLTAKSPVRKAKKANILLIGTGDTLRACNPCGQAANNGLNYARIANRYRRELGDSVNIYCMPIPTAVEYYCPDEAKSWTRPEHPVFNNMFKELSDSVFAVNVYNILGEHVAEHIFSRTDHHWAPLGAYYAAMKLCQVAGVPFADLSHYTEKVVHRYVGTMASFSGEQCVRQAPEDFFYYVPNTPYKTTYINYTLKNHKPVKENAPKEGAFFTHYPDGSGGAYCTFMSGDSKITQVRTEVNNHRRVLIFKDSFGNAIPGYLFFSFEEVHVVDFRFFTRNIKKYVKENKITDVVFANNLTHACGKSAYNAYVQFLNQ